MQFMIHRSSQITIQEATDNQRSSPIQPRAGLGVKGESTEEEKPQAGWLQDGVGFGGSKSVALLLIIALFDERICVAQAMWR
jgi:hypothetical protein